MVTLRHAMIVLVLAVCLFSCGPEEKIRNGGDTLDLKSGLMPFPWKARVENVQGTLSAQAGTDWSLQVQTEVDLTRHDPKFGRFTGLTLAVQAFNKHDENGDFLPGSNSLAISSNLTTTGLPIERFDGWPRMRLLHGNGGSLFEAVKEFPLNGNARAVHRLEGLLVAKLPKDLPAGYYEPRLMVFVRVEGVEEPILLHNFRDNANGQDEQVLPMVKVGQPAAPRIPMTILAGKNYRGQAGALSSRDAGAFGLCARSGFSGPLILPPGQYELGPYFPTLFPAMTIPPVDGGLEVFPEWIDNYFRFETGKFTCSIQGPGVDQDFGELHSFDVLDGRAVLDRPLAFGFEQSGEYKVKLTGTVEDAYGRTFEGGGEYSVMIAQPLTFSTSCKPGTSFLVGDAYPAKINVLPGLPATVTVAIEYYPNSDRSRKRSWYASGPANRFGHYIPYDVPPLVFDEPGEYVSKVSAQYLDPGGRLWAGQQISAGVIAPVEARPIQLHGVRTFPYNLRPDDKIYGAVKQFTGRADQSSAIMPFKPGFVTDSFPPYNPTDTLFVPSNGFDESLVEPQVSLRIADPKLRALLVKGHRKTVVLPPPLLQLQPGQWAYLKNVMEVSSDSAGWFPADEENADEIPVSPVAKGALHPYAYPENNRFEAYSYLGVIRPGFPVMTGVFQSDALGLYWLTSPNRFGGQINAGTNGDLPGDVYRVQAGAVLKDLETGENYYDAYGAAIAVARSDGKLTSILPPGEKPLVDTGGRKHRIFLGIDTHDALEVGEKIFLGGMVFPAIEAEVLWEVTTPDGEIIPVHGKANRLGLVRGTPALPVDHPGLYRVETKVTYGELTGDIVGTTGGEFWHCAVPVDAPPILETNLAPRTPIDPVEGLEVEFNWPEGLANPRLSFGVLMPGQVLDQGTLTPAGNKASYRFHPAALAAGFPNLDSRNYATGEWEMADTVVFQIFFEAEGDQGPVYDSLRLVLRGNKLLNPRPGSRTGPPPEAHHSHPGPDFQPEQSSIQLQDAWLVRYASDPNVYLDISFEGDPESIRSVTVEVQGPSKAYPDISLHYDPAEKEWQRVCDFLPKTLAGGIWWIRSIRAVTDQGELSYKADRPTGTYQRVGAHESTHLSPVEAGVFYVTKTGSPLYYIETFAPEGAPPPDTNIRVFSSIDSAKLLAINEDYDVEDPTAKLVLPLRAKTPILIQVYGAGISGAYGIRISETGFSGIIEGKAEFPDRYESDNAPSLAKPLRLGEIQLHSISDTDGPQGDEDWFLFTPR
jgi:hypothetical protein